MISRIRIKWWFDRNVRYRLRRRHHVNLRVPANYYDPSTRMLLACFALLEDYVEVELASLHAYCSNDDKMTLWNRYNPWWRNAEWGINYLQWEIDNPSVPADQKNVAKQALELYNWWKVWYVRFYANFSNYDFDEIPTEAEEREEQLQLKRLIEIREGLWT